MEVASVLLMGEVTVEPVVAELLLISRKCPKRNTAEHVGFMMESVLLMAESL
jgi:hypothetical protein